MNQPTFADLEYECKKRKTRRELFLERMDGLIPWGQLESRIRPYYPEAGRGRHPYELSAMLRIHCVRLFYNLSDPGMEDMLYEVESVRRFVGLRLSGPLPDETTILNFRHLLEEHDLGEGLFKTINVHLETRGLRLREGTIVDASIIEAPSSTKKLSQNLNHKCIDRFLGRFVWFLQKHREGPHGETRDARDHLGSTGRALGTDRTYHPGGRPAQSPGPQAL